MILISHRGNILGRKKQLENNPNYIDNALKLGYDVEVDVWSIDKQFYLGHDEPQYKIERSFLQNKKLSPATVVFSHERKNEQRRLYRF